MAYRPRSPVAVEHAAQWIAVLRIAVGLYFVKSLVSKMSIVLLGGFLPFPTVSERWISVMPKIVAKQASENPILFYKQFLFVSFDREMAAGATRQHDDLTCLILRVN